MTSVRLLTAMAGPDQAWSVGDVYVCDEAAAARLVAAGRAEWLAPLSPPIVETTMTHGAPERAVKPRGRARG